VNGGDEAKKSKDKTGDQRSQKGPKIVALSWAKEEAREILTETQYWLAVGVAKRLCDFGNPLATRDLRISQFGDFWALKLKGSWLRKTNLRIYFAHLSDRNEVVILMTYKKEKERRVSPHVMLSLEDRLEQYLTGMTAGASVFYRPSAEDAIED
jgi:hypothetical protein